MTNMGIDQFQWGYSAAKTRESGESEDKPTKLGINPLVKNFFQWKTTIFDGKIMQTYVNENKIGN